MGGAMALNLLEQGWAVQVCDVVTSKAQDLVPFGAVAQQNAAQTARNSLATIVCVVDATQCEDVLFGAQGLAGVMRPGQVVLLCPTLAPQEVESFAQRLVERGIALLDAPMSGGPARARDGSMSLMVAGDAAVFTQMAPLLSALSSQVFRISERVGDGARTKLVNNLAAGINLVGAAEVLALAQKVDAMDAARVKLLEAGISLADFVKASPILK